MSLYDYTAGQRLELFCHEKYVSFYGVVQCAMRMADSDNLAALAAAFPVVWEELQERYKAPGGRLEGDT